MQIQQGSTDLRNHTDLGEAHNKPFMTSKLGRNLERASYLDLCVISLLAIIIFTTYFTLAPRCQGIPQTGGILDRIGQALYFTLVTATSLGYGDLSPLGFGRVVSCATVLFGLTIVTLVIGKIASERSQATLFLLHTSDRERRLQGFAKDISHARQCLERSITDQNIQEARQACKDMANILESASNYIYFHAYHSKLGDYGNAPSLYRLLRELRDNVRPVFTAMLSSVPDLALYGRLERLLGRMEGTFKTILKMQSAPQLDWTSAMLVRIKLMRRPPPRLSNGQAKLSCGFTQQLAIGRRHLAHSLTIDKQMKVLAACPSGPVTAWAKGVHKQVALECGVSNSMATKCIDWLLQEGYLPK